MSIVNPMPQAILYGINDRSKLIQTINENIPAHFPLLYTLAGWGSYDGEVITSDITEKYGSDVTDPNSPYGTHQSLLAGELLGVGNSVMTKRVKLHKAKQALIRLSVEVATFLKPVYQRDENNAIVYRIVNGVRTPVVDSYINATRLIWHTTNTADPFYPANFKDFGKGITLSNFRTGNTVGNVPAHYPKNTLSHGSVTLDPNAGMISLGSTIYPILDALMVYDGNRGNQIGLVFDDITSGNSNNINLSASLGSYIYGLKIVEIDTQTGRRMTIPNLNGESSSNIVFGESVYNPRTNAVMSIKDVLEENYELFEKAHLYHANYEKVMREVFQGRTTSGIVVTGEEEYLGSSTESLILYGIVDILKGAGTDSQPYTAFTVEDGPAFGGILLNDDHPVYGMGGSDGLVYDATGAPDRLENLRLFDEAVRFEFENFGDTGYAFRDMAKYPITTIWDTGFALATKKAMCSVLARRRDIYVALATFTVADYVEVVDIIDTRISCAGATSVTAFVATLLNAIEIDGELFTFPNDIRFQAMGDLLAQYGLRLMISPVVESRSNLNLGQVNDLYSEICNQYGISHLFHYKELVNSPVNPTVQYIYYIENINPNKETRIRIRPAEDDYFPSEQTLQAGETYPLTVYLDMLAELRYQNRTLGKVSGPEVIDEDPRYQVTVCLSKYVPRAISCAGATSEVAVILDTTQRYSLMINGVARGVGLTVKEMTDVFKALKLEVKLYVATEDMTVDVLISPPANQPQ